LGLFRCQVSDWLMMKYSWSKRCWRHGTYLTREWASARQRVAGNFSSDWPEFITQLRRI